MIPLKLLLLFIIILLDKAYPSYVTVTFCKTAKLSISNSFLRCWFVFFWSHSISMPSPSTNFFYCPPACPQELKLPTYHAHSPQIGMRRYFADLLAVLSNRYQLCPTARHLAVYLLDLFMDHYDVAVRQLYVIALSCLLLASKLTAMLNSQYLLHEFDTVPKALCHSLLQFPSPKWNHE